MGKIAYLDTVMRVDDKQLGAGLDDTNRRFDRHGKAAKKAKAANDSMFSSFKSGEGVAGEFNKVLGNIDGRLGGISSEMLGAATAGGALAAGLGAIVAVGGVAAATIHSIALASAEVGRELDAQAVGANLTRREIQAIGYATEAYGISTEKAADILKDFQDKLGDFRSTGGGAFADFFEQVGDKVGLTADKLAAMAGPQALIAVKKAMDDANVSADRQVFYMEALAGDAARLIPLLAENGKQFEAMTSRYREMNVELSDSELEKFKQYEQDIKDLGLAWDKLSRDAVAPFVGYLGQAARYMFDFLNTSKSERLGDLKEEISNIDSEIASLASNIEKYGDAAAGAFDGMKRGAAGVLDGGLTGGVGALLDTKTPEQRMAQLKADLQDKLNEKKELEADLNRKAGDGLDDQTGTLTTIVDLEQKRLDLIKDQVSAAKSNTKDKDSLYSKLFGGKEKEKKNYKRNFEFESSAKAASRLISDGFGDGAKRFLAEAEASYRSSKGKGDLYDVQGMKDVILMLREQAGLGPKDLDNPDRKKPGKTGDGESYAMVKFTDSETKFFEATAKNTEEMNKNIAEFVGAKTAGFKAANDQQPGKKFVLELKKAGTDKGISIMAESKEDFGDMLLDYFEGAVSSI